MITAASSRFDLRDAARCMDNNLTVASEVLADPKATEQHKMEAKALAVLTRKVLANAIRHYLRQF